MAELGVPLELADQAGPCPVCWQPVVAPRRAGPAARPAASGIARRLERPLPAPEDSVTPARNSAPFQARHVIPPRDTPPDESWKKVHAERRKKFGRRQKLDRASNRFLESRFFFWFRCVLGVALVGFVGFTFFYMKTHKWRPWWKPAPVRLVAPSTSAGGTGDEPVVQVQAPFPEDPAGSINAESIIPAEN